MIGNDIVDLKTISTKWQRPGFLDKVFTSQEQDLIYNSDNRHRTVWRLWSMKEAAYKNYLQHNHTRFFNPKRLKCTIINKMQGIVSIDEMRFYTNSESSEDYIHTVATINRSLPETIQIFQSIDTDQKSQSTAIKEQLILKLSRKTGLCKDHLSVEKLVNGTPVIYYNSKRMDVSFSLSHCGRFAGYTIY